MEPPGIRVMLVDDHLVVGEGIRRVIEKHEAGVFWLGQVTDTRALLASLAPGSPVPQVVLLDLDLRDGSDPAQTVGALTERGIAAIIFTAEWRPVPIRAVVRAGAAGVALKSDPPFRLVAAIEAAHRGDFFTSSELAYLLATDPELTPRLAPREVETLRLLASGIARKSVGRHMSPPVTESTVVTYIRRVMEKYRALGRPMASAGDAVRAARDDGFL